MATKDDRMFWEAPNEHRKTVNCCDHCQKPFTADVKGMKCGGCFLPRYCSKDCQATHWKSVHKKECKSFQNDPCAVITKDLNVRPLSTTMAISCFQRVVATKAAANPTLVGITKYSLPRRLAESILEAINIHQDSPTVIVKGLSVLNLAIKGPSHSDVPVIRRLVSIGVVDTLVSIFKAHPNDAEIPNIAFTALTTILAIPEAHSDLNIPDMCEVVVRAFQLHGMSGPVAHSVAGMGLGLVSSICYISNDATACLISCGVIPVVIAAMKAHPNDSCVKDYGCSAISCLAHNDRSIAQLTEEGACEMVLQTIHNRDRSIIFPVPPVVSSLQVRFEYGYYGLIAIYNLCSSAANKVRFRLAGVADVIVEAMQCHQDHPMMALWGCRATARLIDGMPPMAAKTEDAMTMSATLGEAGACECVIAALEHHGSRNEEVRLVALRAVKELSILPANAVKFSSPQAKATIVKARGGTL